MYKDTNFDLLIELFAAVAGRTREHITWEKIHSHQDLSELRDPLAVYKALGNDAADLFAKEQWDLFPDVDKQLIESISEHVKTWSSNFEKFCSYVCSVTHRISKHSRGEVDCSTIEGNQTEDGTDELSHWAISGPVVHLAIPDIPNFESTFIYGEMFMRGLRLWLSALTWPQGFDGNSPGITWLELYVDFVCSTGIKMPTCLGKWEGCNLFEATKGAILLRENPLVDRLAYFRQAVRAVSYLANQTIFPFDHVTNKCRSLMRYESGRKQSGITVRPQLVAQEMTMRTIRKFHSEGRNQKGTGGKLAMNISIHVDHPILNVAPIEDSCPKLRIKAWLNARYRNCAHRARIKKNSAHTP
eukprot:Skav231754  [mRNA]  locus=scaffold695:40173:41243:+ [translate_table: standard]